VMDYNCRGGPEKIITHKTEETHLA
jgi:hypothetical protein